MTSSGGWPTVVYARTAVRICPISPAAVTLWPCTSPITAAAVPAGRRHQVVEVAADLHALGGGQIAGGRLDAGQRRQRVRQQGGLQAVRQLVLGVVEAGPLQRLRDQPAEAGQHRPLVRREGVRLGVGENTGADRPPGRDQRQIRPGREAVGRRAPSRIQALQLLAGTRRRRAPRCSARVCRASARSAASRRTAPPHADPDSRGARARAVGRPGNRASTRAWLPTAGRDLVRDQLHHVLHAHRLGERSGQTQHLRDGDQPRTGVPGLRSARGSSPPPPEPG